MYIIDTDTVCVLLYASTAEKEVHLLFISGLQKLTLLDYPGRMACTVFTGGCNFRCPFCHNAPLVLPERLAHDITETEVLEFLKKRRGIPEGVAVTGGEPLMHREIDSFLEKVKNLGFLVKLDTNGSFPEHLESIVHSGLADRVAMDIKNSPEQYASTTGVPGIDISKIEKSKDFLLSGSVDYEFRTTVVKGLHTAQSLKNAALWIKGAKEYYLQQYKDSRDVINTEGLSAFSEEEMHAMAEAVADIIPAVAVRGI